MGPYCDGVEYAKIFMIKDEPELHLPRTYFCLSLVAKFTKLESE
jgi:hypothetical protein